MYPNDSGSSGALGTLLIVYLVILLVTVIFGIGDQDDCISCTDKATA